MVVSEADLIRYITHELRISDCLQSSSILCYFMRSRIFEAKALNLLVLQVPHRLINNENYKTK